MARVGKAYNTNISVQTKIVLEDQPEDPEGSEGSTAKKSDSTNNMPAENDDKMTNSDGNDAQNEQTSWILMLVAHKKK